jgi:hypothetical protein
MEKLLVLVYYFAGTPSHAVSFSVWSGIIKIHRDLYFRNLVRKRESPVGQKLNGLVDRVVSRR